MGNNQDSVKNIVGGSHGFYYNNMWVWSSALHYNENINLIMKELCLGDRATIAILSFIFCLGVVGIGLFWSLLVAILELLLSKGQ